VPAGTPTNAAYAKLPDFLTETGTIGNPKADVNKLALLSLAAKGIGGAIPGIGGTAGNLIQGLSNLGGTGAETNGQSTSKGGNLIQGLGGLLGGTGNAPANTNAPPSTNQPAPAKQQPLNDLLNDLLKKPKK